MNHLFGTTIDLDSFQERIKQLEDDKEAAFELLNCQSFDNNIQYQVRAKEILDSYKNKVRTEIALLPNFGLAPNMLIILNYAVPIVKEAARKKENAMSVLYDPFGEDEDFCNTWLNKIISLYNNINNWLAFSKESKESASIILKDLKNELPETQVKLLNRISFY